MEVLFPILLYVGLMAMLVWAIGAYRRGHVRRLNAVFAAAAEQLEGDFTPGVFGWLNDNEPKIAAKVGRAEVEIDIRVQGSGKNKRVYTRIRCRATSPREVALRVYREGFFSGLARAVGFQDVPIGDPEFDEAYMVKASDEMFARAWLNRTVRNRIRVAEQYVFELKRGWVIAERSGYEDEAPKLVQAAKAAATFADGKHQVVRSFRKVAKQLGGKAKKLKRGWASLEAEVDGVPVTVTHEEHGHAHFTVVTASAVGARLTPFVLTNDRHEFSATLPKAEMHDLPTGYASWTREPERAASALAESVKARIDDLQPIKVRVDEERVKVFLVGIDLPSKDMVAAARLAAMLAVGQGAAYR